MAFIWSTSISRPATGVLSLGWMAAIGQGSMPMAKYSTITSERRAAPSRSAQQTIRLNSTIVGLSPTCHDPPTSPPAPLLAGPRLLLRRRHLDAAGHRRRAAPGRAADAGVVGVGRQKEIMFYILP